jgi:lipopolysaccharide transport system permease protein
MQIFLIHPVEIARSAWRNRDLVGTLIHREVIGRYRGSYMGLVWSFLNPMLMLCVYTFVFSVVFKSRWNPASSSKVEFALVLFAGLIVFNVFSECIGRAPTLILNNANYVKKVVFPLEILPWVALGSAAFHAAVSVVVWLLAYVVLVGMPHATALLLPLVLFPLVLLVMGLTWFLAALGVYLRDVSQFVGILTTVLLFVSPVFYPATALPPAYGALLVLNPLTPVIEAARDVMYWGKLPDATAWLTTLLISALVGWLGFAWFQKTRKGFADVI